MLKTVGYRANECRSYQEALDDFGITELLTNLSKYSNARSDRSFTQLEPQEIENLATILISQLVQNITATYASFHTKLRLFLMKLVVELSFFLVFQRYHAKHNHFPLAKTS